MDGLLGSPGGYDSQEELAAGDAADGVDLFGGGGPTEDINNDALLDSFEPLSPLAPSEAQEAASMDPRPADIPLPDLAVPPPSSNAGGPLPDEPAEVSPPSPTFAAVPEDLLLPALDVPAPQFDANGDAVLAAPEFEEDTSEWKAADQTAKLRAEAKASMDRYQARRQRELTAVDVKQVQQLRQVLDNTTGATFCGPSSSQSAPFGRGFAGNPQGWKLDVWQPPADVITQGIPYEQQLWLLLKAGTLKCVATKSGYFPLCHFNVTVCLMHLPPDNGTAVAYKNRYHWMYITARDEAHPDPHTPSEYSIDFTPAPFYRFTQLLNHRDVESNYRITDLHFQCASACNEDGDLTPLDPTQRAHASASRAWASDYLQLDQEARVDAKASSVLVASLISSLQLEFTPKQGGAPPVCVDAQLTEFHLGTKPVGHTPSPDDWVVVEHHSLFEQESNLRLVVGTGTKGGAPRTPGNLMDAVARTDVSRPAVVASGMTSYFEEDKNVNFSVQIQPSRHSTALPWWNDAQKQERRRQALKGHGTRRRNRNRRQGILLDDDAHEEDHKYTPDQRGPRRGLDNFPEPDDDNHYVVVAFHAVSGVPADPNSATAVREVTRRPCWVEHALSPHQLQHHWIGLGPLVAVAHNQRSRVLGLVGPSSSTELKLPDGGAHQHVKAIHWLNPEQAILVRLHSKHPLLFLSSVNSAHSRASLTSGTPAPALGARLGIDAPLDETNRHRGSDLAPIESMFNALAPQLFRSLQKALHAQAHSHGLGEDGAYELQQNALHKVRSALPARGLWCATPVWRSAEFKTGPAATTVHVGDTTATLFAQVGLLTPGSPGWEDHLRGPLGLAENQYRKGAVCLSQPTLVLQREDGEPEVVHAEEEGAEALRRAVTMGTRQACLTGVPVVIEQTLTMVAVDETSSVQHEPTTPVDLRYSGTLLPPDENVVHVPEGDLTLAYVVGTRAELLGPGGLAPKVRFWAHRLRADMLMDLRVPRAGRTFIEVGEVEYETSHQASCAVRVYFVPDETRAVSLIASDGRANLRSGPVTRRYRNDDEKSVEAVNAASRDDNSSHLRLTVGYSRLALPAGFVTLFNRTDNKLMSDMWRFTPLGFATTLVTALLHHDQLPGTALSKNGRALVKAGLDSLIGAKRDSLNLAHLRTQSHICATKYLWSAVYPALSHFRTPHSIRPKPEVATGKKLGRPDVMRIARTDRVDTDTARAVVLAHTPASHPPMPGLMAMDLRGAAGITAVMWASMTADNVWAFKERALELMKHESGPQGKPFTRLLAPALGAPFSAEWLMLFTPVPVTTLPPEGGQPTGITAFWAGQFTGADYIPRVPLGPDDAATEAGSEAEDETETSADTGTVTPAASSPYLGAGQGAGAGGDDYEDQAVPSPGYEPEISAVQFVTPPRQNASASSDDEVPYSPPVAPLDVISEALQIRDADSQTPVQEAIQDEDLRRQLESELGADADEDETGQSSDDDQLTGQASDYEGGDRLSDPVTLADGNFDPELNYFGRGASGYHYDDSPSWAEQVNGWEIDAPLPSQPSASQHRVADFALIDDSVAVLGRSIVAEFAAYRALCHFEHRLLQQVRGTEGVVAIPVYTVNHLLPAEPCTNQNPGDPYVLITPAVRALFPPVAEWPPEIFADDSSVQAWPTSLGVPHAIFDDIGSMYAPGRHKYLAELRANPHAQITLRLRQSVVRDLLHSACKRKCRARLAFPREAKAPTEEDYIGRTVPTDTRDLRVIYEPHTDMQVIPTTALLRLNRHDMLGRRALSMFVDQAVAHRSAAAEDQARIRAVAADLGATHTPAEVLVCDADLVYLLAHWGDPKRRGVPFYYVAPEYFRLRYYGILDLNVDSNYALTLVQDRDSRRERTLRVTDNVTLATGVDAPAGVVSPAGAVAEVLQSSSRGLVLRVAVPLTSHADLALWVDSRDKDELSQLVDQAVDGKLVSVLRNVDPVSVSDNWALRRAMLSLRLAHITPPITAEATSVDIYISGAAHGAARNSVYYRRLHNGPPVSTSPVDAKTAERELLEPLGNASDPTRVFSHQHAFVALRVLGELQVRDAEAWNHVQEAQFLLGEAQVRTAVSHVAADNIQDMRVHQGDPLAVLELRDSSTDNQDLHAHDSHAGVVVPTADAAWYSARVFSALDAPLLANFLHTTSEVSMEVIYPRVQSLLRGMTQSLGKSLLETALLVARWKVNDVALQAITDKNDPLLAASTQVLVRPLCLILFQMDKAVALDQWDAFLLDPTQPALDEKEETKSIVSASLSALASLFSSADSPASDSEREAAAVQEVRALRTDLLRAALYLRDPTDGNLYLNPSDHAAVREMYRTFPADSFTADNPRPVRYTLQAHMGAYDTISEATRDKQVALLRIWVLGAYLHLRRHLAALSGTSFLTPSLRVLPSRPAVREDVPPTPLFSRPTRQPGMNLRGAKPVTRRGRMRELRLSHQATSAARQTRLEQNRGPGISDNAAPASRRTSQERKGGPGLSEAAVPDKQPVVLDLTQVTDSKEDRRLAALEHPPTQGSSPPPVPPLPRLRESVNPFDVDVEVITSALRTHYYAPRERDNWSVVIGPSRSFEQDMDLDQKAPDLSGVFHTSEERVAHPAFELMDGRPRGYELASNGDRDFTTLAEMHLMALKNPVMDIQGSDEGTVIVEALQPWEDTFRLASGDLVVCAYLFTRLMAPFEFQRCFKAVVALLLQRSLGDANMQDVYKTVSFDTKAQLEEAATYLTPTSASKLRWVMYGMKPPRRRDVRLVVGPGTVANDASGRILMSLCNAMASSPIIWTTSQLKSELLRPARTAVSRILSHLDEFVTLSSFVDTITTHYWARAKYGRLANLFIQTAMRDVSRPSAGFSAQLQSTRLMVSVVGRGEGAARSFEALDTYYTLSRVVGEVSSLRRKGVYGLPITGARLLVNATGTLASPDSWGTPGRDYAVVTPTELSEFMRLRGYAFTPPVLRTRAYTDIQSDYVGAGKAFRHANAFWSKTSTPFTICSTKLAVDKGDPRQTWFWENVLVASYRCTIPPSFARYDTALPGFLYVMADGLSFCRVLPRMQIKLPYIPPMMLIPIPRNPVFDLQDFVVMLALRYVTHRVHNEQIRNETHARLIGLGPVPDREVFSWWVRHRGWSHQTNKRVRYELDPRVWVLWTEMLARGAPAATQLDQVFGGVATALRQAVTLKAGTAGRLHWDRAQATSAHVGYHRDTVGCQFKLPAYLGMDNYERKQQDAAQRKRRSRRRIRETEAAAAEEDEPGDDTLNNREAQAALDASLLAGRVVSLPHMSETHRQQNARLRQAGLPVAARVSARPSMVYLSYQSEMDAYLPTYVAYIVRSMRGEVGYQRIDMRQAEAYVRTMYAQLRVKVNMWDREAERR